MKKKVAGREETQISKSIIDIHSIHHDIIQKRSPKRIRINYLKMKKKKTLVYGRGVLHILQRV